VSELSLDDAEITPRSTHSPNRMKARTTVTLRGFLVGLVSLESVPPCPAARRHGRLAAKRWQWEAAANRPRQVRTPRWRGQFDHVAHRVDSSRQWTTVASALASGISLISVRIPLLRTDAGSADRHLTEFPDAALRPGRTGSRAESRGWGERIGFGPSKDRSGCDTIQRAPCRRREYVLRPMLVGRNAERELIDSLLAAARSGQSDMLAVLGGPGTGKTTVCGYARRGAFLMRVVAISGAEEEADLPRLGLSQKAAALADVADVLNGPAKNVVASLGRGASPDAVPAGARSGRAPTPSARRQRRNRCSS
jgi:hypothetical protein